MDGPDATDGRGDPLPDDLTGSTVGRFSVESKLGRGGMGEVYLATDTVLHRQVALKRIAPELRGDERSRRHFLHEAERASGLSDAHIASLYDVLQTHGEILLVMEYVKGETLRTRLHSPIGLDAFFPIALQTLEGVAAAHRGGILHLDLKPENFMVTPVGDLKILDFGVAKRLRLEGGDSTGTTTTQTEDTLRGTPAYMSPEVLRGHEPDARADLFSLGCVFYEILAEENPFRADTRDEVVGRILYEDPRPLAQVKPRIPAALERLIERLIAKEAGERPASAEDVLVELRSIRRELPYSEERPTEEIRRWFDVRRWFVNRRRFARRRWLTRLAIGLGAVVLVAGIFAWPDLLEWIQGLFGKGVLPKDKQVVILPIEWLGDDAQAAPADSGLSEVLSDALRRLTSSRSLQVALASADTTHGWARVERAALLSGANLALSVHLEHQGLLVHGRLQLLRVREHQLLRHRGLEAPAGDALALTNAVLASAAGMLDLGLTVQEGAALLRHGTHEPRAFRYYLQGLGALDPVALAPAPDTAIARFQRALAADPRFAWPHVGLARAHCASYTRTRQPAPLQQAARECSLALALDPGLPEAHLWQGKAQASAGRCDEAAAEMSRATELDPTNDRAYLEFARAYEACGQLDDADRTYRTAMAYRQHNRNWYVWYGGFCLRHGRYPQAAQLFERLVALAPDHAVGYGNLGGAYVYMGRYADAIPVLLRADSLNPNVPSYSNLGTAYFNLRRYDRASEAFRRAIEIRPGDCMLWGNLGDAYYMAAGQAEEAREAYQRAATLARGKLQQSPGEARTWGALAKCEARLGAKDEALAHLEKGLALAPQDPDLLFQTALVYTQLRQIDIALKWLEKALRAGYSVVSVADSPELEPLRGNPRFKDLLHTSGDPEKP